MPLSAYHTITDTFLLGGDFKKNIQQAEIINDDLGSVERDCAGQAEKSRAIVLWRGQHRYKLRIGNLSHRQRDVETNFRQITHRRLDAIEHGHAVACKTDAGGNLQIHPDVGDSSFSQFLEHGA